MDTEDGQFFIKQLAYFVRTHEKSLANALQLQRKGTKHGQNAQGGSAAGGSAQTTTSTATSTIAAALSLPSLSFTSQTTKPVKLTLTPHHLFYLLSRFEELGINVGPMNVRLENIHTEVLPGNYVSFMGSAPKSRGRASDADSIHSVSSVRSVMSSMSSMWSRFQLSTEASKIEKQKAAEKDDLKYLYSAFTKIPCLRLAPDHRSKLIAGYQEFPFDTAVPLFSFKNLSALEICDIDFRQLHGWDRLAEQLRSLTIKRGSIDDLTDLLVNIVLDDADKRRRRSSKHAGPSSPSTPHPAASPSVKFAELIIPSSTPPSPMVDLRRPSIGSPQAFPMVRGGSSEGKRPSKSRQRSVSPQRPVNSRHNSSYAHPRGGTPKFRRSSGSSNSSIHSSTPKTSSSNLLHLGNVQAAKWRFLRHLSLTDNSLTYLSVNSLQPLSTTLHSLDLSNNLFNEIPDSLASLTNLRALNLSNCMIASLQSLSRNPLPAINIINLRSNRLASLAGVERLFSLEKIDLRDNRLSDPTELARLTRIPDIQHVYVHKNPFVRTHSNYRVTIFNLFRSSPGYTEDIVIDSTGPSYGERRQLVDRVPEPQGVPVVRMIAPEEQIPASARSPIPAAAQPASDSTNTATRVDSALASDTDQMSATLARKKGTRRRMVELAMSDAPPSPRRQPTSPPAMTNATPLPLPSDDVADTTVYHTAQTKLEAPMLPSIDTRSRDVSPSPARASSSHDLDEFTDDRSANVVDVSVGSTLYKQKIEALKSDFGNNWLAALNEDKWDRRELAQDREFSPARTIRPGGGENRSVSVGGRTLG